jgi:trans-aconitate methyltransferase
VYENTLKCDNCGHVHRVYPGDSIKYHQEQYRTIERRHRAEIDIKGNVTELFHEKRKDICSKRIDMIDQYLNEQYSWLDIGAGAGTFAKHLQDKVDTIECTELDPSLIRECRKLGFTTYEEDFLKLENSKKYDVVSAWHVLEHVEDIESFLKKASQLVSKYCIIEVPLLVSLSGEGRQRKLKNPTIDSYDGHTHYFSKQSFETIASKYFNILEIKEGVQTPALLAIMERKK